MAESNAVEPIEEWYTIVISAPVDPEMSAILLESFSQREPGEPQVEYCIGALRATDESLNVSSTRVKSNESAQTFRVTERKLFASEKDLAGAAEMYTKCIAYALPGSQELSFAYANRSAVAFRAGDYEECLRDIERSLENNYPEEMRAKLHARRVRCFEALGKPLKDIEEALEDTRKALPKMPLGANGRNLVEKTLADRNHMTPTPSTKKEYFPLKPPDINDDNCSVSGATGMAIRYSEKYGRHLVATKDIRPGEIIAVFDTYAHAQDPEKCYRQCNHCAEATPYGIPCEHCVNVIYCSTSCRDEAWEDYHKNECPIMGVLLDLKFPDLTILGIRIALKAVREAGGVKQLKKMVKKINSISDPRRKLRFTGNISSGMKYADFYTLTCHNGEHPDASYILSVQATVATSFLARRTEILGRRYNDGFQAYEENPLFAFLGALIIRNCEILAVTASTGVKGSRIALLDALCNHSCDSNVICISTEKSVTKVPHQQMMVTLRPIKAGEQLWASYGRNYYGTNPKQRRQESLKENFCFTCDCVPCVQDWPMHTRQTSIFMSRLSPTVRAQLSELKETYQGKLKERKETGDPMVVKDALVGLLEFFYEHAYNCPEIIWGRDKLMEIYSLSYHPSQELIPIEFDGKLDNIGNIFPLF